MNASTEPCTAAFQAALKGAGMGGAGRSGRRTSTARKAARQSDTAHAAERLRGSRVGRGRTRRVKRVRAPASMLSGMLSGISLELQLSLLLSAWILQVLNVCFDDQAHAPMR